MSYRARYPPDDTDLLDLAQLLLNSGGERDCELWAVGSGLQSQRAAFALVVSRNPAISNDALHIRYIHVDV